MQFRIRTPGFGDFSFGVNSDTGITDGEWHHLQVTWDKSSASGSIAIDGQQQTIVTVASNTDTNWVAWDNPIYIGALSFDGLSSFFNGQMAGWSLYDKQMPNMYKIGPLGMFEIRPRRRVFGTTGGGSIVVPPHLFSGVAC